MSPRLRDRIAAAAVLAVALVWIVLVYTTITPDQGTAIGPRAFPLIFGIVLGGLALALMVESFVRLHEADDDPAQAMPSETTTVVATIGSIVFYGALMEPIGFIPSTILVVAVMMVFVLRIRAPLKVAAMSIGLSLGCYLVFSKLLGTYLPPGTWITIYI